MDRVALITGIAGQDGSYLAELLLRQGYEVHGTDVCAPDDALSALGSAAPHVAFHCADLTKSSDVERVIRVVQPNEVYNLAAQSSVAASWKYPVQTAEISGLAVARLLETVRQQDPSVRFFQAGSSEMFGRTTEVPQCESTRMRPCSPYGVAKLYAHGMVQNYRETRGMFACSGILFCHESPRRDLRFVGRKISHAVARIKLEFAHELRLGNLGSRRDWGFAGDHVRAMWLALQQDTPDDYVIGTGEVHSVEEFVCEAFACVDLDWRDHVIVDPDLCRPEDTHEMVANAAKARRELDWRPGISFDALVRMMVSTDLELLSGVEDRAAATCATM